jgi:hypothetical protein
MPDLTHMLGSYDGGLLNIIAAAWGIEIDELSETSVAVQVAAGMLTAAEDGEMVTALPEAARTALDRLIAEGGRLPFTVFTRQSGEIRVMGAGRREREKPDQNPSSPAEILWYAGVIGRAFLDDQPSPREFIFVPDDLMPFFALKKKEDTLQFGRPAAPEQIGRVRPTGDRILDDACTLLAALRMGLKPEKVPGFKAAIPVNMLKSLLAACKLIDASDLPVPENTRKFLESPRPDALLFLFSGWRESLDFNELLLLPHLIFEGEVQNDPLHTREHALRFLQHIPGEGWCDLSTFVADVHDREPDFQRPAGDYDSWFIRRKKDREFLRGFHSWDEVDGSLLRFFITAPLHWLGIVDLAAPREGGQAAAFRLSACSSDLLAGKPPSGLSTPVKPLMVKSDGTITIPRECPHAVRYQVARACRWVSAGADDYRYLITPESLEKAVGQGLKINYLLSILNRHHQGPLPPNITQAMERWEKNGPQAHIKQVEIISFDNEKIHEALRSSPAGRCLLETLNPTSAIIRPGTRAKVMRTLLEMGYLTADSGGGKQEEKNDVD